MTKGCGETLAFVSPACDKNLRVNVYIPVELGAIELFDCFAQTRASPGMGIVIWSHGIKSCLSSNCDPFRRREVHVALAEVQAI
jgi:hypothetical protein